MESHTARGTENPRVLILGGTDLVPVCMELAQAMAMKRAVGMGRSEGFGEEKCPGHAGVRWSRGARPSSEALDLLDDGAFFVLFDA